MPFTNQSRHGVRHRSAATLVEMVVVMGIIVILAGTGFLTWRAGTRFTSQLDERVKLAAAKVRPKNVARAPRIANAPGGSSGPTFLNSPMAMQSAQALPQALTLASANPLAANPLAANPLAANPVAAPVPGALYGITNTDLIIIDPATAASTNVGKISIGVSVFSMDFRAGTLYVMGEGPNQLYEVDPATAATIGSPISIAGGGNWLEGDLAFRSDGVGFISRGLGTGLRSFDLAAATPTFTNIGSPPAMDGLAFNASDVLYGLKENGTQLYTINVTTGVETNVGSGTGLPAGGVPGVGGLAFDSSGNLYGAISYGGSSTDLVSINPTTGVGTKIGTIGSFWVRAIRFANGTSVPPTPPPTSTNRRPQRRPNPTRPTPPTPRVISR